PALLFSTAHVCPSASNFLHQIPHGATQSMTGTRREKNQREDRITARTNGRSAMGMALCSLVFAIGLRAADVAEIQKDLQAGVYEDVIKQASSLLSTTPGNT